MVMWTDDPATSSTRIRVVHIGELRRTLDFYRAQAGLPAMVWTDHPLSTSTHIKEQHFNELRAATQDLWTVKGLGTLPNWSVGSAPSISRQVSARDINDLRTWVTQVDPPLTIWTGFHWCSPVDNSTPIPPTNQTPNQIAEGYLENTGRWGAVIIVGSSPGGIDGNFTDACSRVMSVRSGDGGGASLDQCVARIYYGTIGHPNLTDIGSVSMADSWLNSNGYYNSLNFFVNNGGRNVVIFNELNNTNEPQSTIDSRVMGYLARALYQKYYNSGNRQLFTLFPGPTGLITQQALDSYWSLWDLQSGGSAQTFGQVYGANVDQEIANLTMLWDGGSGVFDRLVLHCYANNPDEFSNPTISQNAALQPLQ